VEIIRRKTDYGLRALAELATQPIGKSLLASEISEAVSVPENFLHKILQELQQAGLVKANRGRGGGFTLAKSPSEISLWEVVQALQGPFVVNRCLLGEDVCSRQEMCGLRSTWVAVQSQFVRFLEHVSLGQLALSHGNHGHHAAKAERATAPRT